MGVCLAYTAFAGHHNSLIHEIKTRLLRRDGRPWRVRAGGGSSFR